MANKSLAQFYEDFNEEIQVSYETDSSGWNKEDFFTSIMLEYLEDAGEVNDYIMCPFRGYGLQLNAYSIAEDFSTLDIFVSIYLESDKPRTVSQTDIDVAVKRAIQLYHKAINDLYTSFQKDNDTYEFAITLHDHKNDIKTVRICALTNGTVKPINFKNITISEAEVSFSIWDIDRLYRCVMSGKMRETKLTIIPTTQFRKDYKLARKRGLKIELLQDVIACLAMGEPLPEKNRDHALTGDWVGHRECHIQPDWLLVYRVQNDVLVLTLTRTGTHSDLFGK